MLRMVPLKIFIFLLFLNGINCIDFFSIDFGISRFKMYWNIPTEVCRRRVGFNPEAFDIITNTNQSFLGDKIVTLYEGILGLYPAIDVKYTSSDPPRYNITEIRNGGLPQRNNLTAHIEKVRLDIAKIVPDVNFDGPIVIDYEAWRPMYHLNWGNRRHYLEESVIYVQARFPGVSRRLAKLIATDEFNAASRKFMTKTIRAIRKLRPRAYVGFYDYTMCNYDAGKDASKKPTCSSSHHDANEMLYWLYSESNALFPAFYYYDAVQMDEKWRQRYTYARINEAVMMRDLLGWKIPIFPFSKIVYKLDGSIGLGNYYTKSDQCLSLSFATNLDIQGIILWGSSKNVIKSCDNLKTFMTNDFGPNVVKVMENSAKCDIERCNGHGRCVRKFTKDDVNVECDYHRWIAKNYTCSCDLGYSGDECQSISSTPEPSYQAADADEDPILVDTLTITLEDGIENEPV